MQMKRLSSCLFLVLCLTQPLRAAEDPSFLDPVKRIGTWVSNFFPRSVVKQEGITSSLSAPSESLQPYMDPYYWNPPSQLILKASEGWETVFQNLCLTFASMNAEQGEALREWYDVKHQDAEFYQESQTERRLISEAFQNILKLPFCEESVPQAYAKLNDLLKALEEEESLPELLAKRDIPLPVSYKKTVSGISSHKIGAILTALVVSSAYITGVAALPAKPLLTAACDGPFYDCLSSHVSSSTLLTSFAGNQADMTALTTQSSYVSTANCIQAAGTPEACMTSVNATNNAGYYSQIQTFKGGSGIPTDVQTTNYLPNLFPTLNGTIYTDWNATTHKETPFQIVSGVNSGGAPTLRPGNYNRYQVYINPGDLVKTATICNAAGDLCYSTFTRESSIESPHVIWQGYITSGTRSAYPALPLALQTPSSPAVGFPVCTDYYSCIGYYDPALLSAINIPALDPVYRSIRSYLTNGIGNTLSVLPLTQFSVNASVQLWDVSSGGWPNIQKTSYNATAYPARQVCVESPFSTYSSSHQKVCGTVSPLGVWSGNVTTTVPQSIFVPQRFMDPSGQKITLIATSQGNNVYGQFISSPDPRVIWEGVWNGAQTPISYASSTPSLSTNAPQQARALEGSTYASFPLSLSTSNVADASGCGTMSWSQWVENNVNSDSWYTLMRTCLSQKGLIYTDSCRSLMSESRGSYVVSNTYFYNSSTLQKYTIAAGGTGVQVSSSGSLPANTVTHFISRYTSPPQGGAVVLRVEQNLQTNAVSSSYSAILGPRSSQCKKREAFSQAQEQLEETGMQLTDFMSHDDYEVFEHGGSMKLDDPYMSAGHWWNAVERMQEKGHLEPSSSYMFEIHKGWEKHLVFVSKTDKGISRVCSAERANSHSREGRIVLK